MTSRRRFLALVPLAGTAALARAQAAAPVDPKDPTAVAFGYVLDATQADKAKFPKYAPGQTCGSCALYQGGAAATGHAGALDRIKSMMEELLASVPRDKPIPYDTKLRLYELSYAIFFAGAQADDYVSPINELMRRKVASRAPPFGMIEHAPTRLCDLVARLEGQSALQAYPFCTDPQRTLDD